MKVKVSNLTGYALDWAVAKCEAERKKFPIYPEFVDTYSTDWALGGPIIDREDISIVCVEGEYIPELRSYSKYYVAEKGKNTAETVYGSQGDDFGNCFQICEGAIKGETALIAAMRCYVVSKLGEVIDIPEELI